ncbi:hypothetical protein CFC21_009049, partial [Triticum aestivum]
RRWTRSSGRSPLA